MSTTGQDQWYWCIKDQRAEQGLGCRAQDRLGPYATQEEAINWRESVKRRNKRWDAEDERWSGR